MKITAGILGLVAAGILSAQSTQVIAFEHARIIDGAGGPPKENATLVTMGERIVGVNAEIPANARRIDVTGRTIIPGLINAHGHLGLVEGTKTSPDNYTRENVAAQLRQYVRYGVMSMVSLGLNRDLVYDLREEQKRGDLFLSGATIFTAGRGIGVPNGAPPLNVGSDQVYRPSTAEEARAAVREMAAHQPDLIKIWVDDLGGTKPKMSPEIYRAVIDEAHKNHLRVAAHMYYLADAKDLVNSGVDILAHSIRDKRVDSALVQAVKSRGVIYIPTLELDESFFIYADHPAWIQDPFVARSLSPEVRDMISDPHWREKTENSPQIKKERQAFAIAMKNLKALYDASVKIAMGTDSGATPVRIQGFAEHLEMGLMGQAGMKPMDVLVASTRGGAAVAGTTDRGTLEPGHYADFVVLDANPLDDLRNTRQISAVWHNGAPVDLSAPK